MKKTLIAALIAGIPAVAAADVTIYGSMRGALENTNTFGAGGQTGINDYSSRIGFKGSEDLGNGLKAIWKIESAVSLDGSNDKSIGDDDFNGTGIGSREVYMGLASDYGTLRIGRINNTLNDLGMLDTWEYGDGVDGLATFTRTGKRLKNSVRFDSATYYGFSGSIGHSFDETTENNVGAENKGKTYFGLNYENGPFAVYYGAQMQEDAFQKQAGDFARGWQHRLEGTYSANNLFVGLGLQYVKGTDQAAYNGDLALKNGEAEKSLKSKEAAFTVGYTIGNITPKVTYAKGWDLKSDAGKLENTGYDQWIVGADYALSKRTTAFVNYGQQKFEDGYVFTADQKDDTIKTFAVGMRHDF